MKTIKFIFYSLGIIILVSFCVYLYKEFFPSLPEKRPVEELQTIERPSYAHEESLQSTSTKEISSKENIVSPIKYFDFPLAFIKVDYPYLYAYDLTSKTIREYNLDSKTYKELYKAPNINFISYSKDFNSFLIKEKGGYYYLDLLKDKKIKLPLEITEVLWKDFDPYFIVNGINSYSYIATIKNNEINKIFDLFLLNADFDYIDDGFIVYDKNRFSPIIKIKNNGEKEFIYEKVNNISLITNKKDLVFVSVLDKTWSSFIIDKNGKELVKFNFGTLKEKCWFGNILICAVPLDQKIESYSEWYNLKINFTDRLIFYNPYSGQITNLNIAGNFDILNPQLTEKGLFFINRYDSLLYLIPQKDLPL